MPRKSKGGNRRTKSEISFNPEKRKEFLTGFRKRKDERRKKAKEIGLLDNKKAKKEYAEAKIKNRQAIEDQYE